MTQIAQKHERADEQHRAAGELTSNIVILRYETWFLAGKLLCDDAKALTGALLWDDAICHKAATHATSRACMALCMRRYHTHT